MNRGEAEAQLKAKTSQFLREEDPLLLAGLLGEIRALTKEADR